MPSLAYFTSPAPVQTPGQSYGASGPDKFKVSSPFTATGDQNVYAVLKGTILLQQQTDINKVNLILRPHDQKDTKLPVKYIIYRGLKTSEFLDSTNISDTANKVKTSGSELLTKMQAIQAQRAAGTAIPVEALFGNELAPASTKNIDEFFFKNLAPSSQLFTIDCGTDLGKFTDNVSIEIVLENPEFFVTVELAKRGNHELDVTSISDPVQKKWIKDLARHFVDPAAFYGFHHNIDGGIEYRSNTNAKLVANTPALVFQNIVQKFSTKNKVYLDIRNENGYSYNYYNNYKGTGTDAFKNIKIGQSAASMTNKEYYTDGWAVHMVAVTPGTTAENDVFLALRVNDNEKPLLAGWNIPLTPNVVVNPPLGNTTTNRVYFADETNLLAASASEFTNTVSFKIPNVPGSTAEQMATIIKLDYIKQIRINDGVDAFPQQNSTDYLFGPINISIPWNSQDGVQWIGSDHYKYFDGLNQGFISGTMEETISALDISLKTITINKKIDAQITNKVNIVNTANTQNVGEYSVIKVENPTLTSTKITVLESFPSSLQTGDKLAFAIEAAVIFDYQNKKVIAKNINLSNVSAFGAGKKVKLMVKKSVETIQTIVSSSLISGNTEIVLNNFDKQGFGSVMLTGMAVETDLATGPNPPDNDNVLFYAVPQYYFKNTGGKNNNAFNFKGATSKNESFIKAIQKFSSDFQIEKYSLQPTAGNFIATLAYNSATNVRENILILGLKKSEFEDLKTAAATQLSPYHIQTLKLKPQGNRLRDQDYEAYYKYNVVVAGLNNAGNYAETTTFKEIYSRDGMIFTSPEYAKSETISEQKANEALDLFLNQNDISKLKNYTYEEMNMLHKSSQVFTINKGLLAKNTELTGLISELRTELNLVAENADDISTLLKQKGTELYVLAKQKISEANKPYTNKDGILYLVRLKMQVIIKNHPKIITNLSSQIKTFVGHFEKTSRGLQGDSKANFSAYPQNLKRVLISGFDPFNLGIGNYGIDKDGDLSNTSGNIALALDGKELKSGTTVKGIIRSGIFPVRWEDFDSNIVEDFFESYIDLPDNDPNKPHMIITISYGIHYDKNMPHDYHLERFACNWRSNGGDNNNSSKYFSTNSFQETTRSNLDNASYIVNLPKVPPAPGSTDERDWTFIESTLPFDKLEVGTTGKIKVTNYDAVVNHGGAKLAGSQTVNGTKYNFYYGFLEWEVFGKNASGTEVNITDQLTMGMPAGLFPPFTQPTTGTITTSNGQKLFVVKETQKLDLDKPFYYQGLLGCDNVETKYFKQSSSSYIPHPTWTNYKQNNLDLLYNDIRIEGRDGSGGTYMSNEIFYRVAYLRKKHNSSIKTGHIHIGFLKDDPRWLTANQRNLMLADIEEMIKKFNDII
ncbi:hypothetical protein MTQ00_09025 [Chryseobacterium sp. B21-037]|uniref:hypothetical protein n=1 Tax=unclassified Chryseobacterium TaxID=2593645 RepID=UPI002358E094|nr:MULTISPECIES: hypothetical protein [unclassified Chryseobacterium]MDC8104680.1 hypothetical protein [Chryseobacterium sp. B21-037]MDQ1806220.1 hypothetical protein [Chryseobacterium sp. CKR4-1]